jgi:uncharacterized repeat protein (TIGR03803 family)
MRKLPIGRPIRLLALTVAIAAATLAHAQTFSVLYDFGGNSSDPLEFVSPGTLAQGRGGNIYTTSPAGGVIVPFEANDGTVFNMTPGGALSELYTFEVIPGIPAAACSPYSGVTLGTDGNFYGASPGCGTLGYGAVFVITPSGNLAPLYNFSDGTDGAQPFGTPVEGTDGNFYGTTSCGGAQACAGSSPGCGTVYKITPAGSLTTLHQFDGTDGCNPNAPLVQATDGSFYGTTPNGGNSSGVPDGVAFKITVAGRFTVLYHFDVTHGANPVGPLVQGSDGNFYGTTDGGGSHQNGVVYRITPAGRLTVLHNFNSATSDAVGPYAGLVQATDGNLYGVALGGTSGNGAIFRVSPTGGSSYSVRHNFDGATDGSTPEVTLLQHTNGLFYGLLSFGGTYNFGTFYTLNEGLGPFVSLVSAAGRVTSTVEILGQGFTGTTGVSFSGVAATYTVVSDSYLTATVPGGATTGSVTVATPGGTLTSNKTFRVTPSIRSFSPTSGAVGTPVVITGVSLTQTSKVTFGGVVATSFTVDSDTQVTATVPTAAKTGKIGITTAGGTAISAGTFMVKP